MTAETIDCAVIGAGVVGLAIARALARSGRDVIILESEGAFGTGTSARNSEVIHAGIYYKPGSLKAQYCVEGRDRLYAYSEQHNVAHKRIGKLIVATTPEQEPHLDRILATARANGVTDLQQISAAEAKRLEPEVCCAAALYSPSTGIIDSHSYMLSLLGDAEAQGAMFARHAPVMSGAIENNAVRLEVGGAEPMSLHCRTVINSAGLAAQAVARSIEGFPVEQIPPLHLAKGNYFSLMGKAPFTHLIYPVPNQAGLGVHCTLDMGGQARFGPDVEWIDKINYSVDPARGQSFYDSIRAYYPSLPNGALQPAFCGIRPKLVGPGSDAGDFMIQGPAQHSVPGLINLFGIESPGMTSSLAIAEDVAKLAAA